MDRRLGRWGRFVPLVAHRAGLEGRAELRLASGPDLASRFGVYLVLEQSSDVRDAPHDRMRPGLNHLALRDRDLPRLDCLRADCSAHGWIELFADRYPHAGGPAHTALFLENSQGFEIEIVVS